MFYNDVEIEAAIEDVVAEETIGFCLCDRVLETLDRQRVLGTEIYIRFGSADTVSGNAHAFNQAVRIALDDGAIHECARVAFVGIADEIFLFGRSS